MNLGAFTSSPEYLPFHLDNLSTSATKAFMSDTTPWSEGESYILNQLLIEAVNQTKWLVKSYELRT